ncbi:hypothetical protein FRB97_001035 [Tulasnella sp. 331]|nr:hypothetical protein FRB98_007684 [Tulasnella sp. 332]KAG8880146.1 hypothetical protein FRB97_001035 [Tulasnella sp. 331]
MVSLKLSAALATLAAHLVSAHYTFPQLITGTTITNVWQYVRMTENYDSQGPVTDVTTQEIRCYETTTANVTSTATVAAGSYLGVQADNTIYHPGYLSIYMSPITPATAATSESAATGATWFKVYQDPPVWTASTGLTFPSQTITSFGFTIPKTLPTGTYLVRFEQIALHVASTFQGAQFYIGCGQVTVTGGGSGKPGPLVAFPGAYTGYEPGILINIYNLP